MANTPTIQARACVRITLRHGGDAWNWAHNLRCSEADLRKALQTVGDAEPDVRQYLAAQPTRIIAAAGARRSPGASCPETPVRAQHGAG